MVKLTNVGVALSRREAFLQAFHIQRDIFPLDLEECGGVFPRWPALAQLIHHSLVSIPPPETAC
jgi:hypothetical protein